LGILDRVINGFDEFIEKEWIRTFMAFFGLMGFFIYMAFWFALYLIYLPINWLWVHKIRGVSK